MSSDNGYVLSPEAQADIEQVWRHTAETWSIKQADRYVRELANVFGLLATMPNMARERREFSPPVRIHVHDKHLVVYLIEGANIVILRILGGQQDWLAILNTSEP